MEITLEQLKALGGDDLIMVDKSMWVEIIPEDDNPDNDRIGLKTGRPYGLQELWAKFTIDAEGCIKLNQTIYNLNESWDKAAPGIMLRKR